MISSLDARRAFPAALIALAGVLLFVLSIGSATAAADSVVKGSANVTIGAGKAGAVLTKSGVKVNRVGAAKVNRRGKRFVAKLPVRNLTVAARTDAALKGGFVLRKGKHAVRVRALNVAVLKSGKIGIGGSIQKIRPKKSKAIFINLFNVGGKANISTEGTLAEGTKSTLRIKGGKVRFTARIAKRVRKQLGLKRNTLGQIAALNVNAVRTDDPVVDQFNAECGVPVAKVVEDGWPAPSDLPVFGASIAMDAPSGVVWGLASSFRGYVYGTMSNTGSAEAPEPDLGEKALQALDGAARSGFPLNPTRGFSFPVTDATYAPNTDDTADDQAIVNGSGTALFCNSKHGFWASISNPTVVIDGANSRIVADISQNLYGPSQMDPWMPSQRVDLADLDLTGVTPVYDAGKVTWTDVPVTLSADAAPFATYPAGKVLDPITVSLEPK